MSIQRIRNFSIIAHIDHGKSSLADCFLEWTQAVDDRTKKDRFLDSMDLERERGITIKAQTVRLNFQYDPNFESRDEEIPKKNKTSAGMTEQKGMTEQAEMTAGAVRTKKNKGAYQLNLIDTPGHVDFSYEVSRSLSACEGALLVVDACQGIEAQTMANTLLALENNLEIIPVINKIDLPSQRIEEVKRQLVDLIGVKEDEILLASAKEKIGIQEILSAVVERIPSPKPASLSKDGKELRDFQNDSQTPASESEPASKPCSQPLRALIFDSWFDSYQGVIALCRIKQGSIKKGDKIFLKGTDRECEVLKLGVFTPFPTELEELKTGEVGFVITGIKEIADMKVGDTVTHHASAV